MICLSSVYAGDIDNRIIDLTNQDALHEFFSTDLTSEDAVLKDNSNNSYEIVDYDYVDHQNLD